MLYDQEKAGAGRLLGLDIVDWSMLLVAIGLTALLKAMHHQRQRPSRRYGGHPTGTSYNVASSPCRAASAKISWRNILLGEERAVVSSYVFAGVGGYYASKQGGLAGVFCRATDGTDWKHALSEIEAFTVFVHPRDPNLVFAGTLDGIYRSTDRGQNFRRADFPSTRA